ncbi:MAG: hypothetical protein AAF704_13190, partial [Cyanobacteria bacterium P01_D01_bin.123]
DIFSGEELLATLVATTLDEEELTSIFGEGISLNEEEITSPLTEEKESLIEERESLIEERESLAEERASAGLSRGR